MEERWSQDGKQRTNSQEDWGKCSCMTKNCEKYIGFSHDKKVIDTDEKCVKISLLIILLARHISS
jgi:hypothetical protein